MSKAWQGNYFEDFELGRKTECPVHRRITAGDVSLYIALTGDRTPRLCRDDLVHPLVVFHTVFGQTVRQVSLNAKANLGYGELRFLRAVRLGDALAARIEVVGLRETSSGQTGIVWVRTIGWRQDGTPVLVFVRQVLVNKRDPAVPTRWRDAPVVPQLAAAVEPGQLVLPRYVPLPRHGAHFWEDYEVGEAFDHLDGHLVTQGDHMQFTRLFQNSARVHFDAVHTNGRPLVYGGYTIPIGYAQSYNGLENRLGLAAINAGAHTAPVCAGDMLFTRTEVIDKADVSAGVGALRLLMRVLKANGQPVPVLELDYWEWVSRSAN